MTIVMPNCEVKNSMHNGKRVDQSSECLCSIFGVGG